MVKLVQLCISLFMYRFGICWLIRRSVSDFRWRNDLAPYESECTTFWRVDRHNCFHGFAWRIEYNSQRIDAVLNNYKETSIKAAERARRGKAITSIHPEKYQVGEIFTGGIKKITRQKLKLNVNKYLWKSRADKSNRQTFWEKFIHTGQREKYFSKNNSKRSRTMEWNYGVNTMLLSDFL